MSGKPAMKNRITIGNVLKMLLGLIWKLDPAYYLVLIFYPLPIQHILNLFIPKILLMTQTRMGVGKFASNRSFTVAKYTLLHRAYAKTGFHSQSMLDIKFPMEFVKRSWLLISQPWRMPRFLI